MAYEQPDGLLPKRLTEIGMFARFLAGAREKYFTPPPPFVFPIFSRYTRVPIGLIASIPNQKTKYCQNAFTVLSYVCIGNSFLPGSSHSPDGLAPAPSLSVSR